MERLPSSLLFNFRWVIRDRLAGCAMPGLYRPIEQDLEVFRERGILCLVSLTRESPAVREADGINVTHLPIPDMEPPVRQVARRACEVILEAFEKDEPVAVHCRSGVGRTGTILGCFLALGIQDPRRALAVLRGINSHYVQTDSQARFIEQWADSLPATLAARAKAIKHRF